jgi:hypothetical protein
METLSPRAIVPCRLGALPDCLSRRQLAGPTPLSLEASDPAEAAISGSPAAGSPIPPATIEARG